MQENILELNGGVGTDRLRRHLTSCLQMADNIDDWTVQMARTILSIFTQMT